MEAHNICVVQGYSAFHDTIMAEQEIYKCTEVMARNTLASRTPAGDRSYGTTGLYGVGFYLTPHFQFPTANSQQD